MRSTVSCLALLVVAWSLLGGCGGGDGDSTGSPSTSGAEVALERFGECVVGPYLQSATETSIRVMWETVDAGASWVEWGPTNSLGGKVDRHEDLSVSELAIVTEYEDAFPRANPESVIHHATITGLEPDTRYYYRVITEGTVVSESYSFRTPPASDSEKAFSFVVYGDNQRSPVQHSEVVDAAVRYVQSEGGEGNSLLDALGMVWVVGDTVEDGPNHDGFKLEYFDPIREVASQVPFYTAVGNHEYLYYVKSPFTYEYDEANAEVYFAYADLPGDERNYSFDYGNAHFVCLDSNGDEAGGCSFGEGAEAQLAWLEADLKAARANPDTDFIFAFHHYPYKTELWNQPWGDCTPCVGEFVTLYEQYDVNAFFNGHVHGMERGNSKEASLYWVDSSGGGAPLINWVGGDTTYGDSYAAASVSNAFDWPEIQKSIDEHGFHVVSVTAGDNPEFSVEYVSLGDLYGDPRTAPEVIDEFTFRPDDLPPDQPVCLYPLSTDSPSPDDIEFRASAFSDADEGDHHHESHWQVTTISGEYPPATESSDLYPPSLPVPTPPVVADRWIRYENVFGETPDGIPIDTQAGDALTDEVISLEPNTTYYWRVRYRDSLGLAWSEWSDEVSFTTAGE